MPKRKSIVTNTQITKTSLESPGIDTDNDQTVPVSVVLGTKSRSNGWKPGQSGNLAGRPKKDQTVTTQLRDVLNEDVDVQIAKKRYRGPAARVLAERMVDKAIRSVNPGLCKEIMDRVDGRSQPIGNVLPVTAPNIRSIRIEYIDSSNNTITPPRRHSKRRGEARTVGIHTYTRGVPAKISPKNEDLNVIDAEVKEIEDEL